MTNSNDDALSQVDFDLTRFLTGSFTLPATKLIKHIQLLHDGVDGEAIHEARVAIRTIRSHLKTFAHLLRRKAAAQLDTELQWLNKKISPIRDCDVHIDLVEKFESQFEMSAAQITILLSQNREIRIAKLKDSLDSARIDTLSTQLTQFALNPPIRRKVQALSPQAQKTLIVNATSATWTKLFNVISGSPKRPTPKQLHRIRIQAKRCRYAYETAGDFGLFPTDHIATFAKELQRQIGAVNDKSTLVAKLAKFKSVDKELLKQLKSFLSAGKSLTRKKMLAMRNA